MMSGDGWGGWIAGAFMMLIFWGGLVTLVVLGVRAFGSRSTNTIEPTRRTDAREILAERYAKGEISEEEFEQRTRTLERLR